LVSITPVAVSAEMYVPCEIVIGPEFQVLGKPLENMYLPREICSVAMDMDLF
jgi:hypothetical protein